MPEDNKDIKKVLDALESKGLEIDKRMEELTEISKNSTKDLGDTLEASFKKEIEEKTKEYATLQEQVNTLEASTKRLGEQEAKPKTFKEALMNQLDENESFKAFKNKSADKASFEVKAGDMTTANTYTGDVIAPHRVEGFFYDPDRMNHIRSFMSAGSTTSDSIRYTTETAIDENSAMRAEAAAYAQSDFDLATSNALVESIGTYLRVSDEMLADTAGITSYIQARFSKKLNLVEDTQLLYGTGASPQLTGITVGAKAYVDSLEDSAVQRWDVLASACIQGIADEYAPNVILVHPDDYQELMLTKETTGGYLVPTIFSGAPLMIKGVPVMWSTAVTTGDFIVGDLRTACQIFDRQGVTIEFSNSDATNFTTGETTIRFTKRLALANYRPNAIVFGDFASALAQGTA